MSWLPVSPTQRLCVLLTPLLIHVCLWNTKAFISWFSCLSPGLSFPYSLLWFMVWCKSPKFLTCLLSLFFSAVFPVGTVSDLAQADFRESPPLPCIPLPDSIPKFTLFHCIVSQWFSCSLPFQEWRVLFSVFLSSVPSTVLRFYKCLENEANPHAGQTPHSAMQTDQMVNASNWTPCRNTKIHWNSVACANVYMN